MTHCENCGAPREGRFCSQCGQNDRDYLRNMFPVAGEIIAETFEVDSRLFRTLRALFLRPGFLSAEFSRNRRAAYIPPVRLYLVSSVLFFFALSLSIDLSGVTIASPPDEATTREFLGEDEEAEAMPHPQGDAEEERDAEGGGDAKGEGEDMPGDGGVDQDAEDRPVQELRSRMREARRNAMEQNAGDDNKFTLDQLKTHLGNEGAEKIDVVVKRYGRLAEGILTGIDIDLTAQGTPDEVNLFIAGQVLEIMYRPEAAVYRMLDALPVAMFLMLPFFALWLKIVYFSKHRYYVEHLIFSIHVHCVAFIGFTVTIFAGERDWIDLPILLAVLAYLFLALRTFYEDTWKWTFAKFVFLFWGYGLLLLTFALGVVLMMFVTL